MERSSEYVTMPWERRIKVALRYENRARRQIKGQGERKKDSGHDSNQCTGEKVRNGRTGTTAVCLID